MNGTIEHSDGLTAHERQLFHDVDAHEQDYDNIIRHFGNIIAPIGILLNSIFLFVVIRVKSMRTIINVYLSNLAVADATYLIINMAGAWATEHTHIASGAYLAVRIASVTMQNASYFFVTVIAVERFSAVRQPLTQRARASKSRAAKLSAGVWIVAVVPGVLVGLDNSYVKNVIFSQVYVVILLLIHLGTFTITVFSYIYIVIKLCQRDRERQAGQTRRVYPVARMLVINTAVFYVLSSMDIANAIISLILLFSLHSATTETFIDIYWAILDVQVCVVIVCVINSSINTLVYSVTSSQYRAAFLEAFPPLAKLLRQCRRCRRPQQTEQIELRAIPPAIAAQELPAQAI